MAKLKILLGDLIHSQYINNYAVPLNVGFIAERAKQLFGNEIDVKIFKFPEEMIDSIRNDNPDIVGLSNYDWNVNLNKTIFSITKENNPNTLRVMGGPNIRKGDKGIKEFLMQKEWVDTYVFNEGEDGFSDLVRYALSIEKGSIKENLQKNQPSILNNAYLTDEGFFIKGGVPESSGEKIIPFPSPWLSGILDPYLNSEKFPLSPQIETNRNCPFQCTFCTWGTFEDRKIRVFDLDVMLEEIRYIFSNAKFDFRFLIGDANFGILKRDITIAEELAKLADKNSKCNNISLTLSKNSLDRNLEICKIVGKYSSPIFAMQTFNPVVLVNSGRQNLSEKKVKHFVDALTEYGLKVQTDLLVGLPGESRDSHIESVKKAFDLGFYRAQISDIRLLSGSEMEKDDYVKEWGLYTNYRVIPSAYGKYDDKNIIEYERCIRRTNHMDDNDFKLLRLFHGYIFIILNLEFGRPLFDFCKQHNFHPIDMVSMISATPPIDKFPFLHEQTQLYHQQAESEWFLTEKKAEKYYHKNNTIEKMFKNGFPKLNYDFGAKLFLNIDLRLDFIKWIIFNLKKVMPLDIHSSIDEIGHFSFNRIQTYPFKPKKEIYEYSSLESIDAIHEYIKKGEPVSNHGPDGLMVKFANDHKKVNYLKRRLKRYGVDKNISVAIQTLLQVDNTCLVREPTLVKNIKNKEHIIAKLSGAGAFEQPSVF